MKSSPFRDPSPPAAGPVPSRGMLGCLAMVVPIALTVAAIVFAVIHPWPGVAVVAAVVVLGVPAFAWGLRVANRNQRIVAKTRLARLRGIAPARGDAWRAILAAEGFEPYLDALAVHVRPAVRMVLHHVAQSESFVAQSRVGGEPLLPPDQAWPRDAFGEPMRFVLQIDLAEVAKARADLGLPLEGTLYAFESVRDFAWTTFVAVPGERVRVTSPGKAGPERDAHACSIAFVPYDDLPDLYAIVDAVAPAWDQFEGEYDSLREYIETDGGPNHKLGGHPNPLQDLPEIEGDGKRRLVMQLDTDDVPGWTRNDADRVYLTVSSEAYADGRLTGIEAVVQRG